MNVFLRKHFLLFFLIALSIPAWGQLVRFNLQTYSGVAVRDTFTSAQPVVFPLSLAIPPSRGVASVRSLGNNKYELTYTANNDFEGVDSLRFLFYPESFIAAFRHYTITVERSRIVANHDYAFGAKNTTASINVLANDFSSNGVLELKLISLTNYGNATFQPGSRTIEFTPAPDFEGVAYLNYVVCNGAGLCDNGTATIQVLGDRINLNDTLQVFTKKNKAQVILIPNNFDLLTAPANGSYTAAGSVPVYTPAQNFTGKDYIRFRKGNVIKTVEVVVIDATDNTIAFDDEAYTAPGTPVELNVLENDRYGTNSGCFTIQEQPQFGTIEALDGLVVYVPDADFEGVDWFTYSVNAPGCGGADETATVYVYVSNFEPAQTKYFMYTPRRTPLIIGNNVPISNFRYKIKSQGRLGTVVIQEGQRDTLINGQLINGRNQIIYFPNPLVNNGIDEFEITYCVLDDAGNCAFQRSVKIEVEILNIGNTAAVMCFNDCVWPGDTNRDGIVNMEDLLPLGIRMGAVGAPRAEANLSIWYGQQGDSWRDESTKHLDTNGDSVVSAQDTIAINTFYGYTHDLTVKRIPFYKYLIALEGDIFFNPGDLVELDLVMGDEYAPVVDLYGFTFPFEYNPLIFKPETVQIEFSKASWLTYNSPALFMSHNNQKGLIETGFTRTSGLSASGFGKIGRVRFVVVTDIDGFRPGDQPIRLQLGGGTSVATNSAGQTFGVQIKPFELQIVPKSEQDIANTPITDDLVKVYPNPAQDLLNLHLNGGLEFEQVLVYNITGQVVYNSGKTLARRTQFDVSRLQNGFYVLSVLTPKGVVNKKFEILR